MKKLMMMSIFGLMAMAANAQQHVGTVLHTSCGKDVMTVPPDHFKESAEYVDYLTELNDIYCGEEKGWTAEARYK